MLKTVYAMAAAALAASGLIAIPALVNASAPVAGEKADLADLSDCELRGWPYYARTCVRDETRNAGRAINVRIIAPDRIPTNHLEAASGPEPVRRAALQDAAYTPSPARLLAPPGWMMSYDEARLKLEAADFIRRTVR